MSPDSPENKCPTCRGRGERYSGGMLGTGWITCERCGGSGRINTSAEEARNQGDFLGDDLSGEHSCHAGCPCHSGPEVHINAPEELSDEDKRIVGDLVNRAAEKMQPDPQCPGLCDNGLIEIEDVDENEEPCLIRVPCPSCSPSPDRETGEERCSECGFKCCFCDGLRSASSAAPTNQGGVARTDGEGEEALWSRFNDSFFRATALLNDTFDLATADGHEFTCDTGLGQAFELWLRHGHNGLIAAAAVIRKEEPLGPYRTPEYQAALENARLWIDPDDECYETPLWAEIQERREEVTNQSQPEPGGEGPKEPVVGEGELRARIEELAEKYEEVAALALGFASEKVSCSSVASDLRSLLVPKEEA